MSACEILHITPRDKFLAGFIGLLQRHDDLSRHQFYMHGAGAYNVPVEGNIRLASGAKDFLASLFFLIVCMSRARKIILHGLFDIKIVVLLFLQPWLLRKCYWVIWGGDLYMRQKGPQNWKWYIKEFFRKAVIHRVGHLVTYVDGDVDLAREWYGARGVYHECIMYPSNVFKSDELPKTERETINIQVGNSADPSNNHLEVLEKLKPFKDDDLLIFVPLSYGDMKYARSVIGVGTQMFGSKFRPITEFLPFDKYFKFLADIDIAIFNHRRQQGMGNTITLLGLGKTVYMRHDVSSFRTLSRLGLKIQNAELIGTEQISEKDRRSNREIILREFSEERLVAQLATLLV